MAEVAVWKRKTQCRRFIRYPQPIKQTTATISFMPAPTILLWRINSRQKRHRVTWHPTFISQRWIQTDHNGASQSKCRLFGSTLVVRDCYFAHSLWSHQCGNHPLSTPTSGRQWQFSLRIGAFRAVIVLRKCYVSERLLRTE